MKKPKFAVVSFPGNNGDTENLQSLRRCGCDAFVFYWNRSRDVLEDVDGYFFGAGFSYEDRGRSGMIAGRDPLMRFMMEEAARGKVVLGNCNGAQTLVESGLIPLDRGLRMSLARNAMNTDAGWTSPGFLNQWVWITPTCKRARCVTADWEGTMHIPIAHGEGRFTTRDQDVIRELRKNDQLAFSYCDANGKVSEDPSVTPNGSIYAIAGICNPAGNVVALMPHPERTVNGDPYFLSIKTWLLKHPWNNKPVTMLQAKKQTAAVPERAPAGTEIFIDTIIVNNEERTVEQAARKIVPSLKLKQWKYFSLKHTEPIELLSDIAIFNSNKERAFIRTAGTWLRWSSHKKKTETVKENPLEGISLLRRDTPDTGTAGLGEGSQSGICYTLRGADESALRQPELLELFANPHASTLERLS